MSSPRLSFALGILLLIAVVFAGFGFFYRTALQPYQKRNTATVVIEVVKGQSPAAISRQLEAMQVIRNQKIFLYYGKLRGSWPKIKAGEYELSPSMEPSRIFDILISGVSVTRPFLVREGANSYEIADQIEAKGFGPKSKFLALTRDSEFISTLGFIPAPKTLEGYLFPDTYFFTRKETVEGILRTMTKRFQDAWTPNEEARARELGLARDEVVTLASVVEKETGAPEERPIIAGVFFNRLKKKMKLQSDPTTIYGIWTRYQGNLRKADLLEATPYNTYTIPALPIGPISNPGAEAIRATLNPASHPFLYFVSRNDGTHVFTPTYEEHVKAVAQFQLNARAREGRSWREIQKRGQSGQTGTGSGTGAGVITPPKPTEDPAKAAARPMPKVVASPTPTRSARSESKETPKKLQTKQPPAVR